MGSGRSDLNVFKPHPQGHESRRPLVARLIPFFSFLASVINSHRFIYVTSPSKQAMSLSLSHSLTRSL